MATPYWRLSAYYFFYFAFLGAYSPYFGLYLKSLEFSAWDIGVLMSLLQVMRLVAPNLWGWLADRTGKRMPIVRVAAFCSLVGFSLLLVARNFPGVFAAVAVLAFFWGAALPLVEAVTLGHLGAAPGGYGRIRLWGSVGFIATVLGVGYLLDQLPVALLVPLCLGLIATVLAVSLWVPDAPREVHDADHRPLWQVLRQREVVALFAACSFMSAAHAAMYIFLSIYLVDHGYGKAMVGWLWSLGVIVEIGVFLFMPRLLAAFHFRSILLFSMACAVVRFLVIGWGVEWVALIVLAQALHGATFGAHHAAAMAAIRGFFRGRHHAQGQALYSSLSFGAGGMIGGLFSGWSWDALGGAQTYGMASVFALLGLLILFFFGKARTAGAHQR